LGSSKFGLAKFGDGITYRALKDALDALNRSKKNNPNDALIGELAIKNGFTLLTADNDLKAVANPDPNARLRQTLKNLAR
jgi:predicted nucleic acid-binding protein